MKKVFTSIELAKALEKGYKITHVYTTLTFDSDNNIFKSYVSDLLKKKVEASGTKLTGKKLDEFIAEHKKRFDMELERINLIKNDGMRALMKIQLNTLWGNLGKNII